MSTPFFSKRPDLRPETDAVRWGQGPIWFELLSHDTAVLSRVRALTGSWPAPASATLARRWRIEPGESVGGEPRWAAWVEDANGDNPAAFGPSPPAVILQAIEVDGVRELLHCREEILGLHGALVARTTAAGERGVILIGPCFSGKSTLSCALWNHGWSFLGDDVALFDSDGHAYPAPRRAWMRNTSRELVGEALWRRAQATPSADRTSDSLLFHPHEIDGRDRPLRTRVDAIVFLSRYNVTAEPARLRPVPQVDGAIALLPYSNLRDVPFATALSRIAPVAESVPIYDLGRGPLDAMIASLNRLVD